MPPPLPSTSQLDREARRKEGTLAYWQLLHPFHSPFLLHTPVGFCPRCSLRRRRRERKSVDLAFGVPFSPSRGGRGPCQRVAASLKTLRTSLANPPPHYPKRRLLPFVSFRAAGLSSFERHEPNEREKRELAVALRRVHFFALHPPRGREKKGGGEGGETELPRKRRGER